MDCLTKKRDGVVVASPQGNLDAQTLGEFRAQTDEALGTGARYSVTDLGAATFVDSAGLGALVRLYKRVRIGKRDVCLARVSPGVKKVLELTRLSRAFEIYPTVEEAAASIKDRD